MPLFRFLDQFDRYDVPWPLNALQEETKELLIKAIRDKEIVLRTIATCACGEKRATLISVVDRFGLPFETYLCRKCGLVYVSPRIAPESMGLYYDTYYHPLHFGTRATPESFLYAKGQGSKIFILLKERLKSGAINFLDIGAGNGSVMREFAEEAAQSGHTVKGLGLEYSGEYIACFNPGSHDLCIRQGGVSSLGSQDGPFNIVIMSHVFEHFGEPDGELSRIKSVITPDALFYIEVPGIFSLRQRYRYYDCDYLRYVTGAHIFNFNLTSLTHMLNRNGFKMLWGNETIEAIFSPGSQTIDVSDNADLVQSFLTDLENNRPFYASLSPKNLGITELRSRVERIEIFIEKVRSNIFFRLFRWIWRKFR